MAESIANEFKLLYASEGGQEELKKRALSTGLVNSFRNIAWRIYLGTLSTPIASQQWLEETEKAREVYENARRKFVNWWSTQTDMVDTGTTRRSWSQR